VMDGVHRHETIPAAQLDVDPPPDMIETVG
jgi:hypothetical protein